jgi:hypothetical protein
MNWTWEKNNQQKHQFRSYYCFGCKQSKPCGVLYWEGYCCECYFQSEQKQAQEYSDFQQVYQREVKEKQKDFQQLLLLKSYSGCSRCKSKAVDFYLLEEEKKLVCSFCLVEKRVEEKRKNGSGYPIIVDGSNPVSFSEKVKWYKKSWGINLVEWLEKFSQLPVNKNCAGEWLKDKEHLESCNCLEQYCHYLVELYAGSLREMEEKFKGCKCEKSEKVRVSSDYYAWCEKCEGSIKAASKKRVIKNRNDPRFWGLEVEEKVLCLECVGRYYKEMEEWQRKKWREYRRRGYG